MFRFGIAATIGLFSGIAIEKFRSFDIKAAKLIPSEITPAGDQTPDILSRDKGNRVGQISKFGFPSLDSIRSYDNFILSYDKRARTASWVLEHLTAERLTGDPIDRSNIDFFEDQSIHPYFRSRNEDYKRSGFDRGHLAAAGNHKTHPKYVQQTFVLSNISPQVGKGFNRDYWNKLEKYVRWKARHSLNLYVCTGPLYLPRKENDGKMYVRYQVIGPNHVAVPTHFFKVILAENDKGQFELESYVTPNKEIDDKIPLEAFRVPIDTIERAAGLLFF